ncbi:unnamed protein product [Vitrella brassicaformis CCMP3155]|uniref:IPT/TIG domain-containing protein n=2 Tax=Vitrella brassicaformis TaxID=1169539 RepID=A0A0G4GBB5_VITBC|nr:unnamed protein product [Vitrella brassicaformis CCMP3155]|eukprot:CEM25961.1 unnamed protein product [Vitrella brassicaformis CCMP3155]
MGVLVTLHVAIVAFARMSPALSAPFVNTVRKGDESKKDVPAAPLLPLCVADAEDPVFVGRRFAVCHEDGSFMFPPAPSAPVRLSVSSVSRPPDMTQPYPTFYLSSLNASATFDLVNEDPERSSGKLYPKLEGDSEAFTFQVSGGDDQYIEDIKPSQAVKITVTWKGGRTREGEGIEQDNARQRPETQIGFIRFRLDMWVLLIGRMKPPPTKFTEIALPRGESLAALLDSLSSADNTEPKELLAASHASAGRVVVVGTSSPATEYSPLPRRPSTVVASDAFLAALVPRDSPPVFLAPDNLLHPVMAVDRVLVDDEGDGSETVVFDATGSHTHEWGGRVTRYIFEVDGNVEEDTECPEDGVNCVREFLTRLDIGEHRAKLTIGDQEGRRLSGADHVVHVTTIEEVPGCALSLYSMGDRDADDMLDTSEWLYIDAGEPISAALRQGEEALSPQWVTASITAAGDSRDADALGPYESCQVIPDMASSFLDPQFKEDIIIRAMGSIEILDGASLDTMKLNVEGGKEAAVWINGKEVEGESRTINLSQLDQEVTGDNRVDFEVRWLVGEAGSSPDGVRLEAKGKNRWRMVHSQRDWPPFVNKVTPDVIDPKGGQEITIYGAGFLNPESLEAAKLHVNGREVNRDEESESDSENAGIVEWSATRITYRTHQVDETDSSGLRVETRKGESNAYPMKVSAAGQMGDIKYKSPKTLLTGLFDLVNKDASDGISEEDLYWRPFLRGGFGLTGAWAPDARTFFVGTAPGKLLSVKFTSNDEIDRESVKVNDAIHQRYPDDSPIGIAFDPLQDPSDPHLYVSHSPVYYWVRHLNESRTVCNSGVSVEAGGPML